ncbi:GFA family protein [Agrobacterium larrymoorei]|uniref:GFA family protein n=1 Tax=Agrobacterium larrymoorei TaxID=160699 RepID=UPI0030BDB846
MARLRQGGCLCGSIRFETKAEPRNLHTCSCEICQRHSGATSLSWAEFDRDDVLWAGPGGTPSTYRSSDYSSRAFCAACGSTLGAIDDDPIIALVWASFDDREDEALVPVSHSFEDVCPLWAKLPGMTTSE